MPSATLGRIFSGVQFKALSSRNSWRPKSAPSAADILTSLDWTWLHERFTVQYVNGAGKDGLHAVKVSRHVPVFNHIQFMIRESSHISCDCGVGGGTISAACTLC